jgi:putative tricarboxylic transport membrane protein
MLARAARVLTLSLAALALAAPAAADWKPTKTVDLIVHTGPGGGSDLLARAMVNMIEKEKLSPVRINVLNKPGGNGAVAAAALSEKRGDPHTIGLITSVWIAGPLTSSEAKVTVHDLKPVAQLMLEPAVFAVRADSPYKTLKDFIEAAKAKPGALKQSGGSVTSRDNIVRLQLQHATGAKWAFVSFQGGGERLAALLGGHVDIMVIEPQEAGEQVRAGKLRVLTQLTESRLPGYPRRADAQGSGLQHHAHAADSRRRGTPRISRPMRPRTGRSSSRRFAARPPGRNTSPTTSSRRASGRPRS